MKITGIVTIHFSNFLSSEDGVGVLQVSVYGMAELSDEEITSTLSDAIRVLKPGKVYPLFKFCVFICSIYYQW